MTKILKVISAGVLLCALSWNGEALGQKPPGALKDHVDMTVSVVCKDGDATFTVTNNGVAWPGVGNLSVYSTDARKLIHQRRLRLAAGQRTTFRVTGVAADHLEFGLWVDPSWFERAFDYDARIKCSPSPDAASG